MILPAQELRRIRPVEPFHDEKIIANGLSYGLSAAGYDVRIAQGVFLVPSAFIISSTVERFTMQFVDITPSTCNLELTWANTRIRVPIKADLKSLREQLELALKADTAKPYETAAHYFHEIEPDPKRALEYVVPALEAQPDHFWLWHLKAEALEDLGRKEEAVTAANTCIQEATKEKDAAYLRACKVLIDRVKAP